MGGPLAGIRVVDLASERAELAGRLLADLGAEVIKVEPPGGVRARRLPPFDGKRSLYWAAVGLGKRSVVFDLEAPEQRERLLALLAGADVLIESFDPGELEGLGLGYAALSARHPRLVYLSVTPYGQAGPLAGAPASELTIEAAGGLLGLQGDGDRPPIPLGLPQAAFHAGAQAGRRHDHRAERARALRPRPAPRRLDAGGRRLDADERDRLPAEQRRRSARKR